MYKRLSAVLFPVMTLLFVGSIYWGYQEHQEKNSILIKAENQYQRAFHDLSFHIDKLRDELGNTLAVNTTSQAFHRKGLVNVWRLTSEAQNEINQLPLTLLPFNKTEEFLSKISKFSYRVAVRDLNQQPLTQDEFKTLASLYEMSKAISQQLRGVQTKVLGQNLRWMDVETALASEETKTDNAIIDGFKTVNKKVSEYPETNWGPSAATMFQKRSMSALGGKMMDPEEIKQAAADFLGISNTRNIRVVENGKGNEYSSYSVTAVRPNTVRQISMDYTKQGGHLIWFMDPRSVGKSKLDAGQALAEARNFLRDRGYTPMEAVAYDKVGNTADITFVGKQNNILIYPEKITVKVALDNGEVIGMQAADYLFEHKKRNLPKPKMNEAAARKMLNPDFKVSGSRLALIKNDMDEEVLCYEFIGRINGSKYRLLINADTGIEETVEALNENPNAL